MMACALDGVLCRLATIGRPTTEALVSQREHELVEEVERVPTAAFHVCKREEIIIHVIQCTVKEKKITQKNLTTKLYGKGRHNIG